MLQGYYDDSADDQVATVFAVGGFIAERDAWNTMFLPAWRNFLNRHGLDYFRMSECVNHVKEPYKSWSKEYGIEQLSELVTIIRRTAVAAVTVTVLIAKGSPPMAESNAEAIRRLMSQRRYLGR